MPRRPTVAIVGCGRAGGSIGLALERGGYRIGAVWSRSRAGRQRAARLLDAPVLADVADVVGAADVVIVAVPDTAIAPTAEEIAAVIRSDQVVVHTSGATSVAALAPVREAGAATGSLHPLQTLPDPRRGADALGGAAVAVTCDEGERRTLHRLVSGWGGRPFPLPDDARVLYHAAAVFASNYVVTALWAAHSLFERFGNPRPAPLLGPLVQASVENTLTGGPERSLTGPVVRGDTETLQRHMAALRELSEQGEPLADAYRGMAVLAATLAGVDVDDVGEATR